ncbi:MAG: GNAT family N-acetyltransferase [Rhizobiales bacterium]|nr:GNAT family N-acetyltransferase [Hyphomicrobiales bacterium]MBA67436.1 GNAT family N-acetyltransferase [Hyphomicrobiales bacterium]|tara:strand:- start:389 stop:991 length:603 start_codon:yes stop_codon:yes gene_type:complete
MPSPEIRAATPENWSAFEELFGPKGACYGCWCTYFLLSPKQRQAMSADEKREVMRVDMAKDLPPGLIAFENGVPVGWVRVGPRADVPRWNGERTCSRPLDGENSSDRASWAVSCFFIRSNRRGSGLTHALVAAAIEFARSNGAERLDAAPIRKAKQSKSVGLFVGPFNAFEKAGFAVIAERKEGRPLMRIEFAGRPDARD